MKRQRQCFHVIKEHIEKYGYPPTVREIQKEVGLRSSATVYMHLENLKKKGYIDWDPSRPRTMKLLRTEWEDGFVMVPVYTPEQLVEAFKSGKLNEEKEKSPPDGSR